jgi:tRNA (guanine37-N1)-methyltransferase
LRIDILTLFPALFEPFLETAFVAVARERGAAAIESHDLRAWATDRHRSVDDEPYGGGPGMVMTPEPLVPAIEALAGPKGPDRSSRVVYLSPQGDLLTQSRLTELAHEPALLLVCGRYEGVDQRVLDLAVDEEISIGDYVLSGGELPAMVLVEGLVRLLPGVLGNPESLDITPRSSAGAGSVPWPGRENAAPTCWIGRRALRRIRRRRNDSDLRWPHGGHGQWGSAGNANTAATACRKT